MATLESRNRENVHRLVSDGCCEIGSHAWRRVSECRIDDPYHLLHLMGTSGTSERRFGRHGQLWLFRWYNRHDVEYRAVVAPHRSRPDYLFVVTIFRADLGIEPGKNYRKYRNREIVYEGFAA